MPEHEHYEDDELFNPSTKHEDRDVPIKPLLWSLVALTVFGVLAHFVVWGLYKAMAASERSAAEAPMTEVARPASLDVPVEPRLQPFPTQTANDAIPPYRNTPVADMVSMHEEEAKVLDNYGWVDRQRGIARIPIDVAKQLVVRRGFPAPAIATPATPTPGAVAPATTGAVPAAPAAPAATIPAPATPATGAAGAQ